jgi:hypothetical protein
VSAADPDLARACALLERAGLPGAAQILRTVAAAARVQQQLRPGCPVWVVLDGRREDAEPPEPMEPPEPAEPLPPAERVLH